MHSVKEKVSNAASAAKAHAESYKANLQEKAEKTTARTHAEKEIAHQRRKAKEAEENMNLHGEKAEHAAEKTYGKHHVLGDHHHTGPVGGVVGGIVDQTHHQHGLGVVDAVKGAVAPAYPLGGHLHGHKHH